jgi:hypothetical protein
MAVSTWTELDTVKAEQIWSEYQKQHDLSTYLGKTAGIDPNTGRVWIGESIQDVVSQRNAEKLISCYSLNESVQKPIIAKEEHNGNE